MTRDELRLRLEDLERELKSIDGAFQTRSMPQKAKDKSGCGLADDLKSAAR